MPMELMHMDLDLLNYLQENMPLEHLDIPRMKPMTDIKDKCGNLAKLIDDTREDQRGCGYETEEDLKAIAAILRAVPDLVDNLDMAEKLLGQTGLAENSIARVGIRHVITEFYKAIGEDHDKS